MDKRDAIVDSAARLLFSDGLPGFTVARVARAARASSALVHYHFATKRRLLIAAAERIAARRTSLRLARLQGRRGLAALDALWDGLVAGAARDAERACHDLQLLARHDADIAAVLMQERGRERAALADALPQLLADLDSHPRIRSEDLASLTATFLDGAAAGLAAGASRDELRAAYDAFCLSLVALGQSPGAG